MAVCQCCCFLTHLRFAELFPDTKVKLAGVAADGEFWIAKVLSTIENLKEDAKHVSFVSESDDEEEAIR